VSSRITFVGRFDVLPQLFLDPFEFDREVTGKFNRRQHVPAGPNIDFAVRAFEQGMVHAGFGRDSAQRTDLVDEAIVEKQVRLRAAAGGTVDESVAMREERRDTRIVCRDEILGGIAEIPIVHPVRVEMRVHPLLSGRRRDKPRT